MIGLYGSRIEEMQDQVSIHLKNITEFLVIGYPPEFQKMVKYQLGLDHNLNNPMTGGKRLRSLFVLLTSDLFGADWHAALPAAISVELLHNFSLVHDDIQDGSETRRGRKSVWKVWGIPQAINTGDALLNLAYLSVFKIKARIDDSKINAILETLQQTCLELTKGQYLDMTFEKEPSIQRTQYLEMIEGKTASLISACFRIGAIIAGAAKGDEETIAKAGRELGLAFQIQDDYLGIWGSEQVIGKSIYSDLMTRKKTYPVILGEEKCGEFATFWKKTKDIQIADAEKIASILEKEGIKEQTAEDYKKKYFEVSELFLKLSIDKNRLSMLRDVIQKLENRTQ